jgi:hypothetical protein
MRTKLLLLIALVLLPVFGGAQTVDKQKVNTFAAAVAHAEGFGKRHAIPTRYHNPGDLKTIPAAKKLPGQKAIGKGGHVIFNNDDAGWNALRTLITKMGTGESRHFKPNMTLVQVARMYAGNWRPWLKIVSTELGVPPTTRVCDLLAPDPEPEPPVVPFTTSVAELNLPQHTPVLPVLSQN